MKFQANAYFIIPIGTSLFGERSAGQEEVSVSLGNFEANLITGAAKLATDKFFGKVTMKGHQVISKIEKLTLSIQRLDSR